MCPPTYFEVSYAINAWMDPTVPGDRQRAIDQWSELVAAYRAAGASRILAGYGFRTSLRAHQEIARLTGRPVISLELVDPRYYHLDVALTVLDDRRDHIAYYPAAFSAASRRRLARLFPDAVIATEQDAYAFGLNGVSDGRHVFLPTGAPGLTRALHEAGYRPVPVDLSELIKAGGSVKCCTQEIRPATDGRHLP